MSLSISVSSLLAYLINSTFIYFFGFWATFSSTQALLFALHTGIAPGMSEMKPRWVVCKANKNAPPSVLLLCPLKSYFLCYFIVDFTFFSIFLDSQNFQNSLLSIFENHLFSFILLPLIYCSILYITSHLDSCCTII